MRFSRNGWFVMLGCFLPILISVRTWAQSKEPLVAGGVFVSVGLDYVQGIAETAGAYVEAPRFKFRPGVEIRREARTGVSLAGPRVSNAASGIEVYAMALFGRGQMPNTAGTQQVSGLSSEVGIGVEKDLGRFVRWRSELSAGFFSGSSGYRPSPSRRGWCCTFISL
jgi:hypothetical protein